jgi:hypothetical protein
MRRLLFIFLLLVADVSLHSNADDFDQVSKADTEFLSRVVKAVSGKDMAWVADHRFRYRRI